MTPSSFLHFVEALLWIVAIFFSLAGYGDLLLSFGSIRQPRIGTSASVGIAVVLFAGGLLNLLHWVFPAVLIAMVLIGLLLSAIFRVALRRGGRSPQPSPAFDRWSLALLMLLAAVLALRVSATVHSTYYQVSDDKNFYLAEPVKMLELHSYAADPFSERRVESSLGGSYFLQDIVLAVLPLEDLQMADRGLGLLLLAAISFALAEGFELRRPQALLLAIFALITPQLTFNQSFVVLPSALFLAMVAMAADETLTRSRPLLQAFLLGAIGASISIMKSTYLPHAVLFCVFLYCLRFSKLKPGWAIRCFALAALGGLAVLVPWMAANHVASGTYFYPLLGKGYDYTQYGMFPGAGTLSASVLLHKVAPFTLPLILIMLGEILLAARDRSCRTILALTMACIVAVLMVGISTGGDSVRRYNYPCMVPVVLLFYVAFARFSNLHPESRTGRRFEIGSGIVVVLTALSIGLNSWTEEYSRIFADLRISAIDRNIEPAEIARQYAALQAALPQDGAVMESLDYPFLLDFRSHTIYLADFPGAASPPPGWPARQSGEALADFLLSHSVRYLAYALEQRDIDMELAIQNRPSASGWQRTQMAIVLDAQRQFRELARTRRKIFDDGRIVVLDLASRERSSNGS